jgi:putative DNA primase/helicase
VRRLDLAPHWPNMPQGADISDWLALGHTREELLALIDGAPDYQPPGSNGNAAGATADPIDVDAEITRLAKLSWVDYDHQRKGAAEKLGVRASILDKLVEGERAELGLDGDDDKQGRAISFPVVESWPEPVDGIALLDAIMEAIGSHVIMAEHSRVACALWVMHTYLLQHFQVTPRLAVHSPVRRCGKTTLLDVLACLVQRPKLAASVTAATVLRVVEKHHPTLLIDEAEAALSDNEELRKVIDSGHRRNGTGMRSVGDNHETREFSTYTPVAIALIGKRLPPTTTDRSIVVDLQRRKQSEKITRFRIGRAPHLDVLARKIVRWIADNGERAGSSIEPQMPDGLYNRAADNWEPLLMVAEAVDGHWPIRSRAAAIAEGDKIEEGERLEMLLSDIRDIFTKRKANKIERADEIPSSTLAEGLAAIEGRPWAEYGRGGKPITPNKLALVLKRAEVAPDYIGPKTNRCRGYTLNQFQDAFERMLAPEKGTSKCAPYAPPDSMGTSSTFQSVHPETGAHPEKSQKPPENGQVHRVHSSESLFQGEALATTLSRGTREQLASLARTRADSLRQGAADLNLDAIEAFVRERVEAAVDDPDQIEPEVATIMDMLFQ